MSFTITDSGFDALMQGAALRARNNGCWHDDDLRLYSDHDEAAADKASNVICSMCGRPRLIVRIVCEQDGIDLEQLKIKLRFGFRDFFWRK
jgi:hypothetical protein